MSFESIMKGLEEAVEISEGRKIGRRQTLTINPVEDVSGADIKALRKKLHVTQVAFGTIMGVTQKTVEAWEKGTNAPNGTARRLISMFNQDPNLIEKFNIVSR